MERSRVEASVGKRKFYEQVSLDFVAKFSGAIICHCHSWTVVVAVDVLSSINVVKIIKYGIAKVSRMLGKDML